MSPEPTRRSRAPVVAGLAVVATVALAGGLYWRSQAPAPAPAPSEASSEEAPVDAGEPPTSFIAFARDFAGFTEWERHEVEGAMLPIGTPPGPTWVYANIRPPAGARRWPVGAILVKVVESSPARAGWTIHAMVKRGRPYNRDGVVGWEFFELAFGPGDAPASIVWRGTGPPSGHGYAAAHTDAGGAETTPLVCSDCHAPAWQDDGVLTRELSLR